MRYMKGVVISGKGKCEVSNQCPLPEEEDIVSTGALIKPLIWSPCTSDAHLIETGAESLPYLMGKALGHEMCGEITYVGKDVKDFKVGDRVIVCAIMPNWRSVEAQEGRGISDNMYNGIDWPDRGGSFVEQYYIRDADTNLAKIPENVSLEQAIMVPDMMCTSFKGVAELDLHFGMSVAVIGIGPVGLMAVRASVLKGAGKIFAVGSRKNTFEVAKEYGATECVDYHDPDYLDRILDMNGGPVDRVLICGGGESELSKGLYILQRGGTLVSLTAYFNGVDIPIDPASWNFGYGDKTIKGVGCAGGRLVLSRMADLISTGRVEPEKLITHTFHGMDKIVDAMDLFLKRDRSLIKPIIYND
jgi:threonine dehydrogenase-like Zn-dependent dehydrogenase